MQRSSHTAKRTHPYPPAVWKRKPGKRLQRFTPLPKCGMCGSEIAPNQAIRQECTHLAHRTCYALCQETFPYISKLCISCPENEQFYYKSRYGSGYLLQETQRVIASRKQTAGIPLFVPCDHSGKATTRQSTVPDASQTETGNVIKLLTMVSKYYFDCTTKLLLTADAAIEELPGSCLKYVKNILSERESSHATMCALHNSFIHTYTQLEQSALYLKKKKETFESLHQYAIQLAEKTQMICEDPRVYNLEGVISGYRQCKSEGRDQMAADALARLQ